MTPTKTEVEHCGLDAIAVVGKYHDLIARYYGTIPDQDILEYLGLINGAKANLKMTKDQFPSLVKEFVA